MQELQWHNIFIQSIPNSINNNKKRVFTSNSTILMPRSTGVANHIIKQTIEKADEYKIKEFEINEELGQGDFLSTTL